MKSNYVIKWTVIYFVSLVLIPGCATFKGDIPVESKIPDVIYISPANRDGIQDEVRIPVKVPEIKGLTITGYDITILNDAGTAIYMEGQPPAGTKQTKTKISIPEEIYWNGTDMNGTWVPDGIYSLSIKVWDKNNNTGSIPAIKVIVDNTPPAVQVTLPYKVFSPNNDNRQDYLQVMQTNSSTEEEWTGTFTDSQGNTAKVFQWKGMAADFTWDGKNNSEAVHAQGKYTYTISSKDLAGNAFAYSVDDIQLDNSSYPINISVMQPAFSPNGDGVRDTITFKLEVDNPAQVVSSFIEIIDKAGNVQASITLPAPLPAETQFNGKNKASLLPDDQYFARFNVTYKNGNNPVIVSNAFVLDTKPPRAVLAKNYKVFSPDGDGQKDSILLMQTTSVENEWTGKITSAAGKDIALFNWKERAITFSWDGKDQSGSIVPDGEYYYILSSTDEAGNPFVTTLKGLLIDTRPTPVAVSVSSSRFSPNQDGITDVLIINPKVTVKDGIVGWNISVENTGGSVVKTFEGINESVVPETVTWGGDDSSGNPAPEGAYTIVLNVQYEKGNLGSARTETPAIVDVTGPAVSIQLTGIPFSPDNDGENDQLRIKVAVNDDSGVKDWGGVINDPAGNPFIVLNKPVFKDGVYTWDGKSLSGELVQAASDYTLEISAKDILGNETKKLETIDVDILVIKDGDKLKISISSIYFKAYTADYLSIDPQLVKKNLETLDRLAVILKKYSTYNIRLEGNAVRIYWYDPKKWREEEEKILLPLSKSRADTIRDALVKRGIVATRMTTYGNGGYQPVVPHGDAKNNWKNRRVEFILIKQ